MIVGELAMPSSRTVWMIAVVALNVLSDCSRGPDSGGLSPETSGHLLVRATTNGPVHDVTSLGIRIVRGQSTCSATPIAEDTVALQSTLPPDGGSVHPFSDRMFILPPGAYHVCATPL